MNRSYETWTPYPNAKCVIGKQLLIGLNIPCCVTSCIFNTAIFIVLSFKVNFTDRAILSLTIADLLTSYIGQPLVIAVHIMGLLTSGAPQKLFKLQRITFFVNCLTCTASVLNIGFVIITRFVQIKRPLRYQEIATKNRLLAACIIVWLSALFSSFLTFITGINLHTYYLLMVIGLAALLFIIIYINMSIVLITKRIISVTGQSNQGNNKALKTALIISTFFVILALPFGIAGFTYFLKFPSVAWRYRSDYYCDGNERDIYASFYFYSILLYHVNAACNPVIYSLRDTRIKSALKKLFQKSVRFTA